MLIRMNKASGFTLIELLLYIGLLSFMLLGISVFLATLLQSRVKYQTMSEIEQQGAQVMQMMTQSVRNATTISTPLAGASGASLSLAVAAPNNPTVFDVSGGVLRMTEGVGSPIPLTNSRVTASGVTFYNLSRTGTPGIVRIEFTLTHVNSAGLNEFDYRKSFGASASKLWP